MAKPNLTAERAANFLIYDPFTGVISWRMNRAGVSKSRQPGWIDKTTGYHRMVVDTYWVYAHQVAWLMFYGEFPDFVIDHINQEKTDNRISNLRKSSKAENGQNRGMQKNNSTGAKGVVFDKRKNKFSANITAFGKRYYLGYFDSVNDAKNAYEAAALKLHVSRAS